MNSPKCYACGGSPCGMIECKEGYICPECVLQRIAELEAEVERCKKHCDSIETEIGWRRLMHQDLAEVLGVEIGLDGGAELVAIVQQRLARPPSSGEAPPPPEVPEEVREAIGRAIEWIYGPARNVQGGAIRIDELRAALAKLEREKA